MKRLFPAPILSVALFGLWLLLNQSLSPGQLLLAALVAVAGPLATVSLRPSSVRIRNPLAILRLLGVVVLDVLASNRDVFMGVLHSDRRMPSGTFVQLPLELHDPNGLAVLAMMTCVIPGTIWSEISLDRSVLLLHVFNLGDETEFIAHFKTRYERPLMEIFQ